MVFKGIAGHMSGASQFLKELKYNIWKLKGFTYGMCQNLLNPVLSTIKFFKGE